VVHAGGRGGLSIEGFTKGTSFARPNFSVGPVAGEEDWALAGASKSRLAESTLRTG